MKCPRASTAAAAAAAMLVAERAAAAVASTLPTLSSSSSTAAFARAAVGVCSIVVCGSAAPSSVRCFPVSCWRFVSTAATAGAGDGLSSGPASDHSTPSSSSHPHSEYDDERALRLRHLRSRLASLGVDPDAIAAASHRSAVDPSGGYDPRFGRSAIRAYRSFVDPKGGFGEGDLRPSDEARIETTAGSIARQIEHLARWHRSREAGWVRHKDDIDDDGDVGYDTPSSSPSSRRTFPLVLILDNLRSAANVGSLFRTADATGCAEVLTCGITPHPGGGGAEKVAKAALGAERTVRTRHFGSAEEAVRTLRGERVPSGLGLVIEGGGRGEGGTVGGGGGEGEGRWWIAGVETTSRSVCYSVAPYPGPPFASVSVAVGRLGGYSGTALIFGNEVSGVDPDLLPQLDSVIEVPMFGTKNSLNVAACAPVVVYEALRRWGAVGGVVVGGFGTDEEENVRQRESGVKVKDGAAEEVEQSQDKRISGNTK